MKIMQVNPCPWCNTPTATIQRDSVTWEYVDFRTVLILRLAEYAMILKREIG